MVPHFIGYVWEFAEQNLPGRFVQLPLGGQMSLWVYLPAHLVADLRSALRWPSNDSLMASVKAAAMGEDDFRWNGGGEFGWLGTWPDLNTPDVDGSLVLHEALRLGVPDEVIYLLIESGADPHVRDGMGKTAYGYARWDRHRAYIETDEYSRIWRVAVRQAGRI